MSELKLYKVHDQAAREARYELHLPDGTIDHIKDSQLEYQFSSECVTFIRSNQNWPVRVKRDDNSLKYTCGDTEEAG